jgi:hypothetical protein
VPGYSARMAGRHLVSNSKKPKHPCIRVKRAEKEKRGTEAPRHGRYRLSRIPTEGAVRFADDDGVRKVFDLSSPLQMLAKLRWENDQIKSMLAIDDPKVIFAAFNAAATAWHLIEWVTTFARLASLKPDKGWQRRFDDPIPLPRGRQLVTLQDAGNYITNLPKAEHDTEEWQAAMQALLLVAEHDGPTMLARIGVMRALNRHVEPVFNPARKDHHWGRRKLARDR